jgi:hypothetical protein
MTFPTLLIHSSTIAGRLSEALSLLLLSDPNLIRLHYDRDAFLSSEGNARRMIAAASAFDNQDAKTLTDIRVAGAKVKDGVRIPLYRVVLHLQTVRPGDYQ